MADWKKIRWWEVVVVGLVIGAAAAYLTGCGSYPTKMQGTFDPASGKVEMQTTEIGTAVPCTGIELASSERVPAEESGGWLGYLVAGLSVIGGFQLAGPKSWANWSTVLRPSSSWKGTGQALAANLGIAHTPVESRT